MRFLIAFCFLVLSCSMEETMDVRGVWRLSKVEGDYYSFLRGILYEFEYGREYRLYLSDSMFYFPTLDPEDCVPFMSKYELRSDLLIVESGNIEYKVTLRDSLLSLESKDYSLIFKLQGKMGSVESNFSKIYYEIYFETTNLIDSRTVDIKKSVDLKQDGIESDSLSYLSYISWVVNSIAKEDLNKIYGLSVSDGLGVVVGFESNEGMYYEIISNGKSFNQPYEILLLRDCLLRLESCL